MNSEQKKLWEEMMARSWEPGDWHLREGADPRDGGALNSQEPPERGSKMWLYQLVETDQGGAAYQVGFLNPCTGEWVGIKSFKGDSAEAEAAARAEVHYLNGGSTRVPRFEPQEAE